MELDEKQLKEAVREAMKEILAEQKPLPVPAPSASITEIIIRCGDPEGVKVLGAPSHDYPTVCCAAELPSLHPKSEELLQRIKEKTGEEPERVVHELEQQIKAEQLAAAIEQYAKKVGIK